MFKWLSGKGYQYQNTRQYLRLPASWPVKFEQEAGIHQPLSSTKDVSAGGISLVLPQPVPVGSRLRLEINVPPLNRSIAVEGRVVRCLQAEKSGFDVGIRFDQITPKDHEDLKQTVERFIPSRHKKRQEKTWWRKAE